MPRSFVSGASDNGEEALPDTHWLAPTSNRRGSKSAHAIPEREVEVTGWHRLQGAVVSGVLGAVAMYAVLAAFALAQDRGLAYPLRAVQAMMSGRRVLPDHPVGSLRDIQVFDYVVAPTCFLTPALVAALTTLWWAGRRHDGDLSPRSTLAAAMVSTWGLFALLVLLVGYREVDPGLQRISSGYGVRALGLTAWVTGHLAYATVLTLCLGRVTRMVSTRRRGGWQPLRGESRDTASTRGIR